VEGAPASQSHAGAARTADSPAVQSARHRRHARYGPPAPPLCDPLPRRVRVCPGVTAQACGLPLQRLIKLALAESLQEARNLGQEIAPSPRELVELPHRIGTFVFAQFAPLGAALRRAMDLRREDSVSLRTTIDHEF
jgi:hypothetical protein